MASGHPDWGQAQSTILVASVADIGELAARLGSADTYTRTGNVLYLTDWESGLDSWRDVVSGAGASVAISTVDPYRGASCLLINSGTQAGLGASVTKVFVPAHTGRAGFETLVSMSSNDHQIVMALVDYDGVNYARFQVRYDTATKELAYRNSAGAYAAIVSPLNLRLATDIYHLFKLVVDLATRQYVRLIVDHVTYDLSGIAPQIAASAINASVEAQFSALAITGSSDLNRLDSTIITINEP